MSGKPGANPLTVAELEKAKSLSAFGKSYRQIGLELKRSDKTIKKALNKTPEVIAEVMKLKNDLADWYEDLTGRMLRSITDDDITKLSAYQRTLSAAVATDKMRLLRNESTQNFSINAVMADLDKQQKINQELITKLATELYGENYVLSEQLFCFDAQEGGSNPIEKGAADSPPPTRHEVKAQN